MAIDERHVIHPETGFAVDKSTGHVVGLTAPPPAATAPITEWPKWITPHESHIVRKQADGAPDHVSVRGCGDWHVNRADGAVTVLVANEEEAKLAEAEYQEPEAPEPLADPAIEQEVRNDMRAIEQQKIEAAEVERRRNEEAVIAGEATRRAEERAKMEAREREEAERIATERRERLESAIADAPVMTDAKASTAPGRQPPLAGQAPVAAAGESLGSMEERGDVAKGAHAYDGDPMTATKVIETDDRK